MVALRANYPRFAGEYMRTIRPITTTPAERRAMADLAAAARRLLAIRRRREAVRRRESRQAEVAHAK
jgi:hypothetical protein